MSDAVVDTPAHRSTVSSGTLDRDERLLFWLAVAGAATSVIVGVLLLVWPEATLYIGAALFGLWLIVHGVVDIVRAVTATADDPAMRALHGVLGVLFIGAGIVCLRNLLLSLAVIATVIGLTWIIEGVVRLASAFRPHRSGGYRALLGALGAIAILGGLTVLLWPKLTLVAMVVVTGIWMVVMGFVQLLLVLRMRAAARAA